MPAPPDTEYCYRDQLAFRLVAQSGDLLPSSFCVCAYGFRRWFLLAHHLCHVPGQKKNRGYKLKSATVDGCIAFSCSTIKRQVGCADDARLAQPALARAGFLPGRGSCELQLHCIASASCGNRERPPANTDLVTDVE